MLCLWFLPERVLAANLPDCKVFEKTKQHDLAKIPRETILSCMARGHDPQFQFRNAFGMDIAPTGQFEEYPTAVCGPSGVCKNSIGERTEASQLPPGYESPNLSVPEVPWRDITRTPLPCGAIGPMMISALGPILGANVHLNVSAEIKALINGELMKLLGKLFGKKADCQDGTYWAAFGNLLTVILPQLGIKTPSPTFDSGNNTFLAPPNTLLGLPLKSTFTVDLSASGSYFILPVGGAFTDVNGQKITLANNVSVQFNPDGSVITSDGGNYRVAPGGMVTLDPHGVVSVPAGAPIPVQPNATLFPMGSMTAPPAWAYNPPLPKE